MKLIPADTYKLKSCFLVLPIGQNIIVIVPGANKLLSPEYVLSFGNEFIQKAKVLVLQLEIPIESSLLALNLARQHGVRSIFNVAPAVTGIPKEMFALTDILCLNESEVEKHIFNCILQSFPALLFWINNSIHFIDRIGYWNPQYFF